MTAHPILSSPDRVDLDRFNDDGGAPDLPPVTSSIPGTQPVAMDPAFSTTSDEVRLSLAPGTDALPLDGSWWPRSLKLAAELPGLVTALARAGRTVARMSVNMDAWADIPDRLELSGLPALKVSCFRTLDPRVVTLGAGTRPWIRLLVIPPNTAPARAHEVLRLASAGSLTGPTDAILRTAGVTSP
ncbi:DUF5994 family protein [Parafrankia sp. EUN1f]|uniref:DUF5994 family protein n=1 Tax=Parafrankia sp. EUN1f TaxID=102897 RepID=UPI0001C4710E|nr:DUF5994 family protein [Parafrankia sp. EUN1f]EFC79918.1 hypothetical protein FrEUN1fDRAFT_6976 [Parafrankia sp. EUN1f]